MSTGVYLTYQESFRCSREMPLLEAELTSVGQLDVAMQFQQAAGRTDALMQMCSYERRTELGNHAEAAEACRGLKHDKKGENYRY